MNALPSAILFDWDNTLIDTFPVMRDAHNTVRAAMEKPQWSEHEARANIRLAAKDAFPLWYPDRAKEAETIYVDHIRAHHLKALKVFDGSQALLAHLKDKGVPAGVVSNKRGEFLRAEIAHVGWAPYFSAVVGADDIKGPGKPAPDGILLALTQLKLASDQQSKSWYVGDTENDLKTAQAAQVIPIFIENHAMNSPAEIAMFKPAITFKNPRECLAYLAGLG